MNPLRRRANPLLLEIATRPWLAGLSESTGRPITLADVPDEALDDIARDGFDGVWLMGAWTTGPQAQALALGYPDLLATYERLLPGWTPEDISGSAYSIAAYEPPPESGGREGLKAIRRRLNERGLGLVLDFVPNHVGIDHAWLDERPELLIRGTEKDLKENVQNWFRHTTPDGAQHVFAHGRDPHFAGWSDTVQIDYRTRAARQAMTDLLTDLASLADGLRCDVAMLVLEDVFRASWGDGEEAEGGDFWSEAIPAVRQSFPELALIAEAYWHLEDRLCACGFDWAYDKDLYDRLCAGDSGPIRETIARDAAHHSRRVHFLENHDEPRAWSTFGAERSEAAAVALYTLPGMRFFQEGQVDGFRARPPVQMRRYPTQTPDESARALYRPLLRCLNDSTLHQGTWEPASFVAAEDCPVRNIVGSLWKGVDHLVLATASFGPDAECARVRLPLAAEGPPVRLTDELTGEQFERDRKEIAEAGLFVEVPAGGAHLFTIPLDGPDRGRRQVPDPA